MTSLRILLLALILVPSLVRAADVPAGAVENARNYLQKSLADDERLGVVLLGLRSTRDRRLHPLYTALLRSSDRRTRLTTAALLPRNDDQALNEALLQRLRSDPAMAVRSEALVQLLRREAITTRQLAEALKIEDDGVRMLAARALIRRGESAQTEATLRSLLRSRDAQTVAQARMSLFGLGVDTKTNKTELRKLLLDPDTPDETLLLLLGQIRRENIKSAAEVARFLTHPKRSHPVRVQAYMALADVAPEAPKILAEAIAAPDETDLFRINLIRILSEHPEGQRRLGELAKRSDLAGAVARFEQARGKGGRDAAGALRTLVIDLGHPLLVEYAVHRMREDVKHDREKATFYVEPMLAVLRETKLRSDVMSARHDRMAAIVELLANLGSPAARKGLRDILNGPDRARRKLTAGALYRSTNPDVCELVRPRLTSPYSDDRVYAALTFARHGRTEAIPVLLDVQVHAETHRHDVLTLANWYLLKFAGPSRSAVESLAKSVR